MNCTAIGKVIKANKHLADVEQYKHQCAALHGKKTSAVTDTNTHQIGVAPHMHTSYMQAPKPPLTDRIDHQQMDVGERYSLQALADPAHRLFVRHACDVRQSVTSRPAAGARQRTTGQPGWRHGPGPGPGTRVAVAVLVLCFIRPPQYSGPERS
ncbi:unnamed protein product [Chrysodeixis includens]|uniref:Uncharacterized protein n=1 Tax=Chrysodeixis includens TaxID=689277 RepID=A0A9N8KUV7_CHRIL|nr:unnamed protein product [Chrysodeixis includens]